jgi:hypothetical protein
MDSCAENVVLDISKVPVSAESFVEQRGARAWCAHYEDRLCGHTGLKRARHILPLFAYTPSFFKRNAEQSPYTNPIRIFLYEIHP